jgi:hypothetical protein
MLGSHYIQVDDVNDVLLHIVVSEVSGLGVSGALRFLYGTGRFPTTSAVFSLATLQQAIIGMHALLES